MIEGKRRKTKMVCTIGPASESPQILETLIQAGMNVARDALSRHLSMIRRLNLCWGDEMLERSKRTPRELGMVSRRKDRDHRRDPHQYSRNHPPHQS